MAKVTYVWSRNGETSPKAQAIGERFEQIRSKRGSLKAQFLIDDARNDPLLHSHFEWNDKIAGTAYRLAQARELIRSVCVKRIDDHELKRPIRAFVSMVKDDAPRREYESIVSVMSDATKRQRLLNQAKAELEAWRERYRELTELSHIFAVIDGSVPASSKPRAYHGKRPKDAPKLPKARQARQGSARPGKAGHG